jgi:hypothetical protein
MDNVKLNAYGDASFADGQVSFPVFPLVVMLSSWQTVTCTGNHLSELLLLARRPRLSLSISHQQLDHWNWLPEFAPKLVIPSHAYLF